MLFRSKSDEDILHSASPLLSEQRASKKRGSIYGTSSSTTMIKESVNTLSKSTCQDDEEEVLTDTEASPKDQCTKLYDNILSPVIKVTSCSPTAQKKQVRASSEDLNATVTTTIPPKTITPIMKKRFVPKHRKTRSLGSK